MSEAQQLQRHTWFTQYRTLPEMLEVHSLYAAYSPGENFELILALKMATRHPIEGYFVSEF